MTINASTRKFVCQRANYLCEYCHSSEEASTTRFTLDHRQPRSLEGSDDVDNLVLALVLIQKQAVLCLCLTLEGSCGLSIFFGLRTV